MSTSYAAQVDKAIQHYLAGNYKKAHKICRALLQSWPNDHNVMRLLGLVENRRGNAKRAIGLLEQAIALAPNVPAYYNNLADIYRSLSDHERAVGFYRQAISRNPRYALAHNNMGISLAEMDRLDEAVECFEIALRHDHKNPDYHLNLAHALRKSGSSDKAETEYRKTLELDPANSEAIKGLASMRYEEMRYGEAIRLYEAAIERAPDDAVAHVRLGDIQYLVNLTDAARGSYHRALAIDPSCQGAYVGLGHVLSRQGDTQRSIQSYERALAINPEAESAHDGLGTVHADLGDFDRAADCYRKALAINPDFTTAYRHLSQITARSEYDEHMQHMEQLLRSSRLTDHQRMDLAFALGKAFEDLRDDDKSMEYFLRANALARREIDYSIEKDESEFREIRSIFSREFIASRLDGGYEDDTPVFIVGMPRSGTSLVEQILSSHSQVYGAGELSTLADIVRDHCAESIDTGSWGDCIRGFSGEELATIGENYVAAVREHDRNARHIVDKMPHNFRHVGLIRLALPRARVIHCRRDPMDTCVSIFTQHFPRAHHYARDLTELGHYYRLYMELMDHWERVLPGYMHRIDYEDLVGRQEQVTRDLLDFCGLPWEDACLNFQDTQRRVGTASNVQVRQKLYTGSVGRWRRYGQRLEPLYDAIYDERT